MHSDQGSSFMSFELKLWLHNFGVPTSRTNRYNPAGNGQVERCNRTIWRTVLLALRSKKLPLTHWEYVLTDVLHSTRSLLYTATNCTPHERMFSHCRKSFNGVSLPPWVKPGPVYVKCYVRNKNDPLIEEAELIEANPHYAHVKLNDGREINVSLRDLARNPVADAANDTNLSSHPDDTENTILPQSDNESNSFSQPDITSNDQAAPDYTESISSDAPCETPNLRRSSRIRRPIDRYGNNIYS